MPPSQLKRLKASLREQGIVGPQQSKKQKKQNSKNGAIKDKRVQRNVALQGIRDQFNPFEVKAPVRGNKFDVTNSKTIGGRVTKGVKGRPGVTKGLGEETRRKTLLVEMHRRNKIGGIKDRRFGENDPTMGPEERALERFTREKQIDYKKSSMFDLEDDQDEGKLTHFGQSLALDEANVVDDFDETDLVVSDNGDHPSAEETNPRKRRRSSASGTSEDEDAKTDDEEGPLPQRRKTKAEVMKEVIAKSKFHKYERQQAKEDDDDLRAELDKGLPDLYALMRGRQPLPPPPLPPANETVTAMNPDREALLNGKDRVQADKEYDERLRQLVFDQRAKPTERTMTEEEKAVEDAKRLGELEAKRVRRMKGDQESSDEEGEVDGRGRNLEADKDVEADDAVTFGFGAGITNSSGRKVLDVEDEDDFLIEDDLVASDSEPSLSDDGHPDKSASEVSESDDELEFVHGLLSKDDMNRSDFGPSRSDGHIIDHANNDVATHLAFTYPCPQSHEELLEATRDISTVDLPVVIQRIRALYHPKLPADNKEKLDVFSGVLVDHISWLANQESHPPFAIFEMLIRHVHSLAKLHSEEVGRAFRAHLKSLHDNRSTSPTAGDLILLTAIGSIFPTSDHFHPVVTPAILSMARYLGQKLSQSLSDLAKGTYLETLCLQYQSLSKRFIPEVLNYTLNALCILAPVKSGRLDAYFPHHEPASSVRLQSSPKTAERALRFWDVLSQSNETEGRNAQLGVALLRAQLGVLDAMIEQWVGKSAFLEAFSVASKVLQHLSAKACRLALPTGLNTMIHHSTTTLQHHLHQARLARHPLLLHHHRPLAIKTSIPKFEESYNPDRHYDPDRDRADSSKLKAEHKRERKGALRELRKDANFIARESLREKKERDREYEKKYKRLVAEIQGEEGKEAKSYEREKRARKGKSRR